MATGQTGYTPLSAVPIGTPVAPPPPRIEFAQIRQLVLSILDDLEKPTAAQPPEAASVRLAMQDLDVRIASRNLPKRESAGADR